MKKINLWYMTAVFPAILFAYPDVKLSFQAGSTADKGIEPVSQPYEPVRQVWNGVRVLAPQPGRDYYRREGLSFRVTGEIPQNVSELFLIITHYDQPPGLIEVYFDADRPASPAVPGAVPAYTSAAAEAGYTVLGTGRKRQAVFRLSKPAFMHRQRGGADITIAGVGSLQSLEIKDRIGGLILRVKREIPRSMKPLVSLSKPMDLVMTAGISLDMTHLEQSLASMEELCPLLSLLGFNGVETYVAWNFAEPVKGEFDWSLYDAIVKKAGEYGLKWFPLLIVGSAYALPDWFQASAENEGFACLEHGRSNNIQSIFCENQVPYVKAFLNSFGRHFEPGVRLLGVRLGPSGNYGESQYPAGGNWGYKGQTEHIHIGWWAGDSHASPHFRSYLKKKYGDIGSLNTAWREDHADFEEIETFIPQYAEVKRKRKDFVDWYMDAMTEWCERWAVWAREAMPQTPIYQSAGGWGFVESGTDFTDQTRSMVKIRGGIRATNETDSYAENFYATRMMSSAARFYGVPFGTEPASSGSARGVAGRIYNILVNNGQHLFFYHPNVLYNDQGVSKWLELAPLLDMRDEPFIEVGVLYPDTKSKLDDGVFRHLFSFPFNQRVVALRQHLDFDFVSERMILDGALPRYRVLVFLWSDDVEAEVLDTIDRWVQEGGRVIAPYWARMPLGTLEDDYSVYNRWVREETGKGTVIFDRGDREPPERYAGFIRDHLIRMKDLDQRTQAMLNMLKPEEVYASVLENGTLAILNYNDSTVTVGLPGAAERTMGPYEIELFPAVPER